MGTLIEANNPSTTYSNSIPFGYQDWTGLPKAIQAQGEGVNLEVQASNLGIIKAWVDWNKDGDFSDPGELVYTSGNISCLSTTFGFVIPTIQPIGDYRIRIRINKDNI